MKRSRGARRPGVAIGSEPTGRHGAIDFALQMAGTGETAGSGDHIYRVIEIVGTSKKSISDAIDRAIARAHKTLRNLRWFEVMRTSGHIDNGKVRHYQVTLSVGFTMEEPR